MTFSDVPGRTGCPRLVVFCSQDIVGLLETFISWRFFGKLSLRCYFPAEFDMLGLRLLVSEDSESR